MLGPLALAAAFLGGLVQGKAAPTPLRAETLEFRYQDVTVDRLRFQVGLRLQSPADDLTLEAVRFDDFVANGLPLTIEPFEGALALKKGEWVDLPERLTIAIYFREVSSIDPLRELLEREAVRVRGRAHVTLAGRGVLKVLTLGRRFHRTLQLEQDVKCDLLKHPLARVVAAQMLSELSDPTSVLGTRWLAQQLELQSLVRRGKALEPGMVALTTRYRLEGKGKTEETVEPVAGVGFFISPDVVLAPKRIVVPWRFDPESSYLLEHGYRVLQGSTKIVAWGRRGLKVEKLLPDDVMTESHEVAGETVQVKVHRPDSPRGLALLSARGTGARGSPLPMLALPQGEATLVGIAWFRESSEREAPVLHTSWGWATATKDGVLLDRGFPDGAVGAPVFDREGRVRAVFLGRTRSVPIQAVNELTQGLVHDAK